MARRCKNIRPRMFLFGKFVGGDPFYKKSKNLETQNRTEVTARFRVSNYNHNLIYINNTYCNPDKSYIRSPVKFNFILNDCFVNI